MGKFSVNGRLGVPELDSVSTTAALRLGTIVTGYDEDTECEGEFVYVKANVALTVGQAAVIDLHSEAALADSDAHVNDGIPVGFVVADAVAADEYCFLQISGKAKVKAGTVAAGANVLLTATGGTTDDATLDGAALVGATFATADGTPAAGFAYANINRPSVQTQDDIA